MGCSVGFTLGGGAGAGLSVGLLLASGAGLGVTVGSVGMVAAVSLSTLGGVASGFGFGWVADVSKMAARSERAAMCYSLIGASGEAGAGFCSANISSFAASVAASAVDVLGMATWVGNHTTVLLMRSPLVSGTQAL